LESKVGSLFPKTRRDALYHVMKDILEMSMMEGVDNYDVFDKIYKLYISKRGSEELIS
jgi:uncharacterized protein YozE (UPF0346 family)